MLEAPSDSVAVLEHHCLCLSSRVPAVPAACIDKASTLGQEGQTLEYNDKRQGLLDPEE